MENFLIHIYFDDVFEEVDFENMNKDEIYIGKNTNCDIVINVNYILDKHVCIQKLKDGLFKIVDSSNGFLECNNIRTSKKIIDPGDVFVLLDPLDPLKRVVLVVNRKEDFYGKQSKINIAGSIKITIGRDVSNNISFKNKLVSYNHASIIQIGGEYCFEDQKSKNGTYLNGILTGESLLKNGDVLNIGGHKLIFDNKCLLIENVENITRVTNLTILKELRIDYPYFLRSPRLESLIPVDIIDIPNPPAFSAKPNISWLAILLPPIGMIAAMAVIGVFMWRSTQSPFVIIGTSLMSFVSLIVSIVTYLSQKKKYLSDEKKRKALYLEALNKKEIELKNLLASQKEVMYLLNPSISECINIGIKRERRLWERNPQHYDFLFIRLGIGNLPVNLKINAPKQDMQIEQDPLLQEISRFVDSYKYLENVPICLPIVEGGTIGIAGKRKPILQLINSLIIQITTHHSYDEVKIVIVFPESEANEWAPLRWLPHIWDNEKKLRFMAMNKNGVQQIFNYLYNIIKFRESNLTDDAKNELIKIPYYVFFIADKKLVENELLMDYLIHNNQKLGVSSLFLFDEIMNLPKDCKYIIDIDNNKSNLLERTNISNKKSFTADYTSIEQTEIFTRAIAPIKIKEIISSLDLPVTVPFLDLYKVSKVEDLNVKYRWENSEPFNSLSAIIGIKPGGSNMILDIHDNRHGPHGLIAGTTGSGKSELLQSLILSLSINYHPHDLVFLLIDYKGGGMANLFKDLPHLAGIITNIGGNITNRALVSIDSEIKRRQELFKFHQVNNINRYQQQYKIGRFKEPLPNLVIIVDEFAELKTDQPDFMSKLVSAARVGRSLGVHLILATQKPSGVVDDQIWSNARFRICLKVQDVQDSREVIKRPEAAQITLPGRAYLQVGNNEMFELFQSSYSGAEYYPCNLEEKNTEEDKNVIYKVLLDGKRILSEDYFNVTVKDDDNSKYSARETVSQLEAVVGYLNSIYKTEKILKLRDLWLSPLPAKIFLTEVINNKLFTDKYGWDGNNWHKTGLWVSPIVGLIDDPVNRSQYPLTIDFEKDGNLAVYGGPGSGKTTFLQTLITSLILMHTPEDINIYIIDLAGRTLCVFSETPHVGGVVTIDELTRIQKLIRFIFKEIDKRKNLFSENGVSNLKAFNSLKEQKMPAIFIVVDNFTPINDLYQDLLDSFINISREGASLGIHLVLSANNPLGIGYRITTNIKSAVALQMPDKGTYMDIVGNTYGLEPENIKGRGMVKKDPPLEFQTCLPVYGESEPERSVKLRDLFEKMRHSWHGKEVIEIPVMPDVIKYDQLIKKSTNELLEIPIGLDFNDLEVQYLNLKEKTHFLVAGKLQCGKTNFLKLLLNYLINNSGMKKVEIYIVDSESTGLFDYRENKLVSSYINNSEQLCKTLKNIKEELSRRKKLFNKEKAKQDSRIPEKEFMLKFNPVVMVVDDFNDFINMINDEDKEFLSNILIRERLSGFHLILSGLIDDLNFSYESIAKTLKSLGEGLLMTDSSDQQVFNIRANFSDGENLCKPGDGFLISRGSYKKIKTPLI